MHYLYRNHIYSGIPHRDEMLAENIPQLNKEELCDELKGLDVKEKMCLETPEEKKIDALKEGRIDVLILGTLAEMGAASLVGIAGMFFKGMLAVQGGVLTIVSVGTYVFHYKRIAEEKGRNLAHLRIDRLFEKVAFIENELTEETTDHANTGELIQEIKIKRKGLRPLSNEDEDEMFHPERTESVKVWSPKAESTIKQMNIAKASFKKIADQYKEINTYISNYAMGYCYNKEGYTQTITEYKNERNFFLETHYEPLSQGYRRVEKWGFRDEPRATGKSTISQHNYED